jgi:hypothetical protein
VRLAGLPLQTRIAAARVKSEWNLKRESVHRNSQLWSSLALGAITALLVMGIFSAARHFAQASLPSNRPSTSRSTGVAEVSATAEPVTGESPKPASRVAYSRQARLPKAKPVHPKAQRAAAAPRRVRHNPDEDYVAEDTYIYYGNRSSR